jgi:hypothetical protein
MTGFAKMKKNPGFSVYGYCGWIRTAKHSFYDVQRYPELPELITASQNQYLLQESENFSSARLSNIRPNRIIIIIIIISNQHIIIKKLYTTLCSRFRSYLVWMSSGTSFSSYYTLFVLRFYFVRLLRLQAYHLMKNTQIL